ncbi:hypothetical protein [Gordonia sp. (in: high G+C Gram-positive bacteria)]|jgi:hypothetical protein|uniref:hypothetical protein n=1 Tax=Gordonia sp. (in: high G+C Gram-positive bacteria) TaxID=84139 RepID=UPI001D4BC8CA|nr:hypothetical protein [Gordonia sp. (in: high G+C Gram-positive bacteria)]MCB1293211.1 hypothetical protein [Gordonia sp. (in: high G+C Gram-positive bacteria)]HMS76004.1 hypothetical protein [Gordonia sp. (in: high G+C Gram-positive bacteria)]HQV19254.1 hypothetical protein [Gordonia sp. (in: high G+C Gram-positive bacteria)]
MLIFVIVAIIVIVIAGFAIFGGALRGRGTGWTGDSGGGFLAGSWSHGGWGGWGGGDGGSCGGDSGGGGGDGGC